MVVIWFQCKCTFNLSSLKIFAGFIETVQFASSNRNTNLDFIWFLFTYFHQWCVSLGQILYIFVYIYKMLCNSSQFLKIDKHIISTSINDTDNFCLFYSSCVYFFDVTCHSCVPNETCDLEQFPHSYRWIHSQSFAFSYNGILFTSFNEKKKNK